MNNKKYYLLFILLSTLTFRAFSQSSIDSLVMNYLKNKEDTSQIFYKIEKKGSKTIVRSNFFVVREKPIIQDGITFTTYLFGRNTSHQRKYFLIKIVDKTVLEKYKIVDDAQIESGISTLLEYVKVFNLSNSIKAQLVNQLSYSYY